MRGEHRCASNNLTTWCVYSRQPDCVHKGNCLYKVFAWVSLKFTAAFYSWKSCFMMSCTQFKLRSWKTALLGSKFLENTKKLPVNVIVHNTPHHYPMWSGVTTKKSYSEKRWKMTQSLLLGCLFFNIFWNVSSVVVQSKILPWWDLAPLLSFSAICKCSLL